SIDILIIGGFTIEPELNERVSNLVFIQVTRHPAKGEKGLRDCSHREPLGRAIIMQYPQTHVISCANQASVLQVYADDWEHGDDPFERTFAPTLKEPKCNHAVGYRL